MDSAIGQVCITNPDDRQAPPKSFTFDGAYYMDSTTEQMYNEIVFNLVEVRAHLKRKKFHARKKRKVKGHELIRRLFISECDGRLQWDSVCLWSDRLWEILLHAGDR